MYIVEPDYWRLADTSARHFEFVRESLASLRGRLAKLGQPLVIRTGSAENVLERARRRFSSVTLWSHEETGNGWTFERDKRVARWAQDHAVDWYEVPQSGVVRRLSSRDGWANNWSAFMGVTVGQPPAGLPPINLEDEGLIPTTQDLGLTADNCPERQRGGREQAEERLTSFMSHRGQPYRKAMSNPAAGAKHCSRLSPYLAWGTLSIREVAQSTWQRRRQLNPGADGQQWRGALSSFESRLHWRDHFMQKLEDEPSIEFKHFHRAYDGLRVTETDSSRLHAWREGFTGIPFVDACMRSLHATGWINFRMRAMLMAVASYHLWLDWRKPGEHLARLFTDYEPGIHWSQAQMQSGTSGINTVRIYNPVKQGYDQDANGDFVRRWLPELADVPSLFIHEPWLWEKAGSLLDKTYPMPIVDHMEAAREARQKIWSLRKDNEYRAESKSIISKHGSRKSGIRNPKRPKNSVDEKKQLGFEFD